MFKIILPILLSFFLMPLAIKISYKCDILPKPNKDRWSIIPTPILGGVVVYISIVWFMFQADNFIFLYALALLGIGLIDDLYSLQSAIPKLVVQVGVALLSIMAGYKFSWFGYWIDIPLIIIWIVGISNAFNLIDNMDGMLGGTSLVSAILFGICLTGSMSSLSYALAAAMIVFLYYNIYPGSIWMGDNGSLFIGYLFAIFGIVYSPDKFSIVPVLILWFPILDMLFVIVTRTIRRQRFWIGDRTHLAHRLSVRLGRNDFNAAFVLLGLQMLIAIILIDLF